MSTPQLLTRKEACAALHCSYATLHRLVIRGALPKPLKIGSRSFWTDTDLTEAVERLPRRLKDMSAALEGQKKRRLRQQSMGQHP
jgi:predicted DNA-binding transcriptional regulator AlpA